MSRRTPFAATLVAVPVLLGGCSLGETIAGIHDAPAESSGGASITEETARDVAGRVLDLAADHRDAGYRADSAERTTIFSGPALREANAAVRTRADTDHFTEAPEDLTVLGISSGREWPRAILATSQDEDTQYLHVLVAEEADQPYTLFADVRMAAGSSVPALAPVSEGSAATLTETPDKEVTSAIDAWAKGVAHPAPEKAPAAVSFDDAFSTALKKNATAQATDLDDLASYRQRQSTADAASVSFDLAEGGTLTFLPMTRTDTFTAGSKAKALTLGDREIRRVLDTSKVDDSLSVKHAETVALVTPDSGKAQVVGASDVLHSAKGS